MERWIEGVCRTNGVDLHYVRTGGTKPPVILLHGLIGSGACWTPIARTLEGDCDAIMLDARGHGGSSAPPRGYLYDDHANDVAAVIDDLALARPIVIGHSMGGMTAALLASRGTPLLGGVVLVDPTFLEPERQREVHASDVAGDHRRMLAFGKSELVAQGRARHPHRSLEILELQAEARTKTSLAAFEVLTPPNPDYRAVMRAIDVPTLLVIGDHTIVTEAMATELRSLNPRVRVAKIDGGGHGLPFDQPDRLAEVVLPFVRT